MRYTVLLPLLGLGLAGCVVATPEPTTTTTTYRPATTETVITQPAGAYMAPGSTYMTPGASSTTTIVRSP
jgi:hypothetical protein